MRVDVRVRDGVVILKPIGDIIGPASQDLRDMVAAQLQDTSKYSDIIFDFADCSRIDSFGLGVLFGLHVSVARKGGKVAVINVGANIKNMFVMAKLITMFEHFHTESEAIINLRDGEEAESIPKEIGGIGGG